MLKLWNCFSYVDCPESDVNRDWPDLFSIETLLCSAQSAGAKRSGAEMANQQSPKDPNRPLMFTRKRLLVTTPRPATRYLIKPVLLRGHRPGSRIIWLYGPAGWFKSNMAVTWTLHLYTGLPFCGIRVPKIESLYIDPDDPDGAIKCAQAWFAFHRGALTKIGI